jgi:hypothetical protein
MVEPICKEIFFEIESILSLVEVIVIGEGFECLTK